MEEVRTGDPSLFVRPREDDIEAELQEAPSLKRKKTVTWADGEEGEEAHEGDLPHRLVQQAQEPVAMQVEGVDDLFTDLREAALREQAPVPKSEGEALSTDQLHARRGERCLELEAVYESEFWALADELLVRSWTFGKDHSVEGSRTTRSRSKYAEISKDPTVAAALEESGVQGAWVATNASIAQSDPASPTSSLPSEDELAEFILYLRRPEDSEKIESLRRRAVQRREKFLGGLSLVARLEASASAATSRELDRRGAVAALCGSQARYFLRRTAITVGRGGDPGIDVDLGAECGEAGEAKAVSRQQAELFLDADGRFKVRCLGRRVMSVNGESVNKGQVAVLPHLSLVRIGPVALLFVVNKEAMDRLSKRSAAMVVS